MRWRRTTSTSHSLAKGESRRSNGWWTGIAFTNAGLSAGEVTVTYVAGGVSVVQNLVVPAQSVKSFLLGDLNLALPAFTPIYAHVSSTCDLNAFVMLGDGVQAQGYLGLSGNCCCGVASGIAGCGP